MTEIKIFLGLFLLWVIILIFWALLLGSGDNLGIPLFFSLITVALIFIFLRMSFGIEEREKGEAIALLKERLKRGGFNISFCEESQDRTAIIALDEENQKLALCKFDLKSRMTVEKIITVSEILNIEFSENGQAPCGTLAGAAVGGLVFGGAGAIVGAMASQNKSIVSNISLILQTTDISAPHITFNFLGGAVVEIGSPLHTKTIENARIWFARIKAMVHRASDSGPLRQKGAKAPQKAGAITDLYSSLKILADLRASGGLTEAEFQTQKKRLLDSQSLEVKSIIS